ncbi:efflux RND transporter periplasmic adaptor subunit [Limnospira fusiformis CCALA 023]|uniref:efflux RND transporter periplasmic adaptor subunit n=1 Tax=Arthrospira sp. PCC 8006 TaxID=1982224 RepID=UPI00396EE681
MSYPSSTESSNSNYHQSVVEVEGSGEHSPIENQNQIESDRHSESEPSNKSGWVSVTVGILLALGVGFAGGQWWYSSKAQADTTPAAASNSPQRPRGVPVRVTSIETRNFQDAGEFVGTLEARESVEVRSEIEGRITQVYVRSGEMVNQGQAIARLRSDDLEAQLRQAQANLVRTQARVAELQAGSRPEEIAEARGRLAESVARLNDAQSGSLLAEINQAQAQIDANIAAAELAEKRVTRFQELTEAGAISRDEFDALVSQKQTAQANLRAAERRLEQLQQNRQSEIALREAGVEQSQQALRRLESGTRPQEIDQAEAQVAEAAARVRQLEVQLQETTVQAPFTGIVGDVTARPGDFVNRGATLTSLTENDRLELRLSIPLERQGDLREGLAVEMQDPQGQPIGTGRISFISPTVNPNSQSILAKATFTNPDGLLRTGQFVRARVIWNEKPNTVVVPMTAVQFSGDERFVFTTEGGENPTAKRQVIRLGLIRDQYAEVVEGLRPGEQLIVSGIQRLSDGAAINPQN